MAPKPSSSAPANKSSRPPPRPSTSPAKPKPKAPTPVEEDEEEEFALSVEENEDDNQGQDPDYEEDAGDEEVVPIPPPSFESVGPFQYCIRGTVDDLHITANAFFNALSFPKGGPRLAELGLKCSNTNVRISAENANPILDEGLEIFVRPSFLSFSTTLH